MDSLKPKLYICLVSMPPTRLTVVTFVIQMLHQKTQWKHSISASACLAFTISGYQSFECRSLDLKAWMAIWGEVANCNQGNMSHMLKYSQRTSSILQHHILKLTLFRSCKCYNSRGLVIATGFLACSSHSRVMWRVRMGNCCCGWNRLTLKTGRRSHYLGIAHLMQNSRLRWSFNKHWQLRGSHVCIATSIAQCT